MGMTFDDTGSLELWLKVVREIIGRPTGDLTLLDLCCNECTGTSKLPWKLHVGVDLVNWPTRPSNVEFNEMHVLQAMPYFRDKNACDVTICSDGIEHLTKAEGHKMLKHMLRIGPLSIIFTPLGPYLTDLPDVDYNHPDTHKSGWWPHEFERMGWETKVYPNWHPTLGVGAFFAWKGNL